MEIKITLFFTLLLYAAVVSQSIFYLLAMGPASRNMNATTYIESRKLLDDRLSKTLGRTYLLTLLVSIALTGICITNPSGLLFTISVISLTALIADILLAIKGNRPLNEIINNWTVSNYPEDWYRYRSKWFAFYRARQIANLTGFTVLAAGIIFGSMA